MLVSWLPVGCGIDGIGNGSSMGRNRGSLRSKLKLGGVPVIGPCAPNCGPSIPNWPLGCAIPPLVPLIGGFFGWLGCHRLPSGAVHPSQLHDVGGDVGVGLVVFAVHGIGP